MISAVSYYRLGRLMQQFLPHILVNQTSVLRLLAPFVPKHGQKATVRVLQAGETLDLSPQDNDSVILPPSIRDTLRPGFENLRDECLKLRLKATHSSMVRLFELLDNSKGNFGTLRDLAVEAEGRLVDELKEMTCFAVEGEQERLYEAKQLFGADVANRFPGAQVDIEEAGRCLALDRPTACVFHLMRVLERGLQALARDLGMPKEQMERNWQQLLQDIEAKVKASPFKTASEKEARSRRAAAVAHLRNVKDAWRNDVIHPRDTYTVEQARDVFNHCRALMVSLAGFVSEEPTNDGVS